MQHYIESDGKLFLVRRNGVLDLPYDEEIPFPVDRIAPLAASEEVAFCVPRLQAHPHEWIGKDEIASHSHVSPVLRESVHASMPRVVVEGVALNEGCVLLVKGSRGLTNGRWALPGGFLRFGETPQHGLKREVKEELKVDARIDSLLTADAKLGRQSRLHWIMLFYRITLFGTIRPEPDEIADAQYVPIRRAEDLVFDSLMREVIASLR